ncbi:UNVERIFIED_CONTAM: hypothetical protein PYX00_011093 [Menopon gallinae]|uniref:Prokaryotic-type class I peptide chain release factors domain-containing protein n=1 Tax=Menopon gallinae TaxID=328185 RepID=A0AAW2H5X2_9NEOP
MSFSKNLDSILQKYNELENSLAKGAQELGENYAKISKEYSDLTPVVTLIKELRKKQQDEKDLLDLISSEDSELKNLAEEELHDLKKRLDTLEKEIQIALLPKDEDEGKNIILEIRAGTGGDEAALFVADLFRMYQKYAEKNRWKVEVISFNDTEKGGFKEVIVLISGKEAFANLKFESGVHRVQRIPDTESNGRVHTSAATVAVLPEALDVDVKINPNDLRIDVYRASGAGGQHVNTTDSAVRITHIPTGIVVAQQSERSQHKNKEKAMKVLMARLYDHEKRQQEKEIKESRKSQVGSGDRSARIRTYNYPQGRITDHRINYTVYKLTEFLNGEIDELVKALVSYDRSIKLSASEDSQ